MGDAPTRRQVPIAEAAAEAYRCVFGHLNLLFDLAWLPLLIMLAVTLAPGYFHTYRGWITIPSWAGDDFGLTLEDAAAALAGFLCLSAFALRWQQRLLVDGSGGRQSGFLLPWLRFLLYSLAIYLASAIILAILLLAQRGGSAPALWALGAAILTALVWVAMVRGSLLYPAAASGTPLGFVAAWRAMRGNSWRLFACCFMVCVPIVLVAALLLSGIVTLLRLDQLGDRVPLGFFLLRGLVTICTNLAVAALGATVLASFYRRIVLRT